MHTDTRTHTNKQGGGGERAVVALQEGTVQRFAADETKRVVLRVGDLAFVHVLDILLMYM